MLTLRCVRLDNAQHEKLFVRSKFLTLVAEAKPRMRTLKEVIDAFESY